MIFFVINLFVIFVCIWPFYEDAVGTNKRKGPNRYLLTAFGYLALIAMLRAVTVGTDTFSYVREFERLTQAIDPRTYIDAASFERGYLWYMALIAWFSESGQVFIAVTAALVFASIGIFFDRYSLMPWISVFLFFSLMMYDFVLSGFRQSLALALVLVAYQFLLKKRYLLFVLIVIGAAQFHTTAYLMLFMLPIALIKTNVVFFITIFSAGLVSIAGWSLMSTGLMQVFVRYAAYEGSTYMTSEGFFAAFLKFVVYSIVLFFGEFLQEEGTEGGVVEERARAQRLLLGQDRSHERNMELRMVVLIPLLCLLTMRAAGASRIIRYLEPIACVYLPNRLVLKTPRNKAWGLLLTVVAFTAYDLVIQLMRTPEWQQTYPFVFFWSS